MLGGPGSLVRRWKEGKGENRSSSRFFLFPSIERDATTLSLQLVDALIIAAVITVGGFCFCSHVSSSSWGLSEVKLGRFGLFYFPLVCVALLPLLRSAKETAAKACKGFA